MFGWFRRRRDPTFDPLWRSILKRNVWQYGHLSEGLREHTHAVVARMVAGKHWEGGGGHAVTAEQLVTVAGAAALLTLGAEEPFDFPHLRTIILYPTGYQAAPAEVATDFDPILGGIEFTGGDRLGEAWDGGPVILSWADVLRTSRTRGDGDNLVLHELAHHLDGLDGPIDGVPHLPDRDERRTWYAVADAEYHRLVGAAQRGEATLLDHYGATNPAEFFAVATESFFEQPHALRDRHGELYAALARYYRQSPAEWLPPPGGPRHRERPEIEERTDIDVAGLGLVGADADFARGHELLEAGEPEGAIAALSRVLDRTPDDGEALELRAEARLQLGDDHGALADAGAALDAGAPSAGAHLAYAEAAIALGRDREAEPHVRAALRANRGDARAAYLDALLLSHAGDARAAAKRLRGVIASDPTWADAHALYAEVCETVGDARRSAFHRERALQLDPHVFDDRR